MLSLAPALRRATDVSDPDSLSQRLRARRFAAFEQAIRELPRPLRLLDIGGTVEFWRQRGWIGRDDVHITVVNLTAEPCPYENVSSVAGDATRLSDFAAKSFDVAFSNSVIEHVGDRKDQQAMASEVRRVATAHWIQSPNFWFPLEPHFLVPGWQWLPEDLRVAILQRRDVGHFGRSPVEGEARRVVRGSQLLTRRQLQGMFPASRLVPERWAGLVKSWTVVDGLRHPEAICVVNNH
jgi:hypothetical protein